MLGNVTDTTKPDPEAVKSMVIFDSLTPETRGLLKLFAVNLVDVKKAYEVERLKPHSAARRQSFSYWLRNLMLDYIYRKGINIEDHR